MGEDKTRRSSVHELRGNGILCAGCGFYLGLEVGHEAYCEHCAQRPDVPFEQTVHWLRLHWWKAEHA